MGRAGRFGRAARAGSTTRRWSAAVHRWLALFVGVVLLFEFVSGTVLLFRPELFELSHPDLFASTATPTPLSAGQATEALHRDRPDFPIGDATWVEGVRGPGVWQITTPDYDQNAYVDPATGAVLGTADPQRGALGLLMNLHDCLLSCEGYTGYVPALAATVPGLGTSTWADLVLGVIGLAFAVLALSGLSAWWPSTRRFGKALRTKLTPQLRRGQYRANRDLHDVSAMVALPLLVVWAITGAGYGFPFVGAAWYAVTGGEEQALEFTPDPAGPGAPDIGPDAAAAAARRVLPGQELVSVASPQPEQGTDYYLVGLQTGPAPARYAGLRTFSESSVAVDRHTGRAAVYSGGPEQSWSDWLWTNGNYGVHFGYIVPWWARLVWLAAGLVTIYLVGSGFWTWWWRRRLRRRRARRPVADRPAAREVVRTR